MSLLAPQPFYKTLCHLVCVCLTGKMQGWGFAHMFSERIAHFWWAIWAICSRSLISSERFAHDHSFPLSDVIESLMFTHFWWATCAICSHRSFLVSNLSDLLTSLIFGKRPERFTHIAHQKRGNKQFAHFFDKFFFKSYIKHTKNKILNFFTQNFLSELLICSFILSFPFPTIYWAFLYIKKKTK